MVHFRSTLWYLLWSASAGCDGFSFPASSNTATLGRSQTTKTSLHTTIDDSSSATTNDAAAASWRQELPETLRGYHPDVLKRLPIQGGNSGSGRDHPWTIYVLGVQHGHPDSIEDVGCLLEAVRPDAVFVELCPTRYGAMMYTMAANISNIPKSLEECYDMIENENVTLAGVFKNDLIRVGQRVTSYLCQTEPAAELAVPIRYWQGLQDDRPALIIGDRPVEITQARPCTRKERREHALRFGVRAGIRMAGIGYICLRTFRKLGAAPFAVAGLLGLVGWVGLEVDESPLLHWWLRRRLLKDSPDFRRGEVCKGGSEEGAAHQRIVIDERDLYMACKLYQSLRWLEPELSPLAKASRSMVVVVGAAHVVGLCDQFRKLLVDQNPEARLLPLVITPVETDQPYSITELVHEPLILDDESIDEELVRQTLFDELLRETPVQWSGDAGDFEGLLAAHTKHIEGLTEDPTNDDTGDS